MNFIRCINGHYYNPNDYEECPYCAYQRIPETSKLDSINNLQGTIPADEDNDYESIFKLISDDFMMVIPKSKMLIIGRDPSCDIVVDDKTVSRRHCKVFLDNDILVIMDLGSKNGTSFNDQKFESNLNILIGKGGVLKLGKHVFTLKKETRRVHSSSYQDTFIYESSQRKSLMSDTLEPVTSRTHCPNCKKAYKDSNDRFCRNCGYKKETSGEITFGISTAGVPLIYGPLPVTVHYECSLCGNQWEGSNWSMDRYCPNCGNECRNDLPENEFKRYG